MGKKTEKLRRIVSKMAARYGAEDTDVQRLQAELEALEAFEFRYPDPLDTKQKRHEFRTAARQLFYANAPDQTH
jgi:hypothetical protein